MKFSDFLNPDLWRSLLGNDFNRGFIAALVLILALILILLFIRLTLSIIFRRHRTSKIIVKRPDGETQISLAALTEIIRSELKNYPALDCSRILLFRQGKKYSLSLFCDYSLKDQAGIPAFCNEFKPKLQKVLLEIFGIEDIKEVKLCIDEVSGEHEPRREDAPVVPDVPAGF